MSSPAKILVQQLRSLHHIATSWTPNDSRFGAIAQDLDTRQSQLKAGKPLIRCVSRRSEAAQALKQRLEAHGHLTEICSIEVVPLPQSWSAMPTPTASLMLQPATLPSNAAPSNPLTTCTYRLSGNQPLLMGRRPDCHIHIPDHYSLVSGHHASIQFETRVNPAGQPTQPAGVWRIRDTSRNGTYVNGRPVQEDHVLELGDRITLGFPYSSETAPLLLFDDQCDAILANAAAVLPALECEVLWLVLQANVPITAAERDFFTQLIRSPIPVKIVALDISGADVQEPPSLPPELTKILESVANQNPVNLNCLPVSLTASTNHQQKSPNCSTQSEQQNQNETVQSLRNLDAIDDRPPLPSTKSDPTAPLLQKFLEDLDSLVKRDAEGLMCYRLKEHTLGQIYALASLLELQQFALGPGKVTDLNDSSQAAIAQIQKDIEHTLKTLEKDHEAFFKDVQDRLKPLKNDLMDEFVSDSISSKIKTFANQLKPVVIKRDRQKILQVRYFLSQAGLVSTSFQAKSDPGSAKSMDANTALMQFCQAEIGLWIGREWDYVCNHHAEGGIQGLGEKLFETLASIPHLNLNSSTPNSYRPRLAIAYQEVFNKNFSQPADETPIKEPSAVSYTLKKIRSQWMQFIFLFSFISILGIAGRRQIMRYITAPIVTAFKISPWISLALTLLLVYFVVRSFKQVYQDDRKAEREKEAQRLREKLCSHYQKLLQNRLLERLIKVLSTEIDIEKQRLESIILTVKTQTYEALEAFAAEQQAATLPTQETQKQLSNIAADSRKLETIKRTLLTPPNTALRA